MGGRKDQTGDQALRPGLADLGRGRRSESSCLPKTYLHSAFRLLHGPSFIHDRRAIVAKQSQIVREEKRAHKRSLQAEKRAALKKSIINPELSDEERRDAVFKLNAMSRDSSKVRHTRRCQQTGRSRGVYRKFQLCRITFREMALQGMLPGVTKASW